MASPIQRIVLIRHDTSLANVDPSVYKRLPDHTIPLAEAGSARLASASRLLVSLGLDPAETLSWCSPYLRCAQTEAAMLVGAFGVSAPLVRRRESFLLREQEFGEWDSLTDDEARVQLPRSFEKRTVLTDNFGRFYFRYPNGESRADVVQRVIAFIGKMHRSDFANHLIFLHGVTQRAFRMAWLNFSVDWFESEPNPGNASVTLIRRDAVRGWIERALPDGDERASEWVRHADLEGAATARDDSRDEIE
jgi:broad specificity phosphatase PhoE